MRLPEFSLAALWAFLLLATTGSAAVIEDVPRNGVARLDSPNGRYEAALSNTDTPYEYWLTITDHGHRLARYRFEGELSSSFWSPDGRYLAINNHNGHRAWHVWVIALRSGAIMHAAGRVKTRSYDAYLDDSGLPDIFNLAGQTVQKLASGTDDYYHRLGPVSVAYGWNTDGKLLVCTEAVSDKLADKEDSMVWLMSTIQISNHGMKVSDVRGEKVKMNTEYPSGIGAWFP